MGDVTDFAKAARKPGAIRDPSSGDDLAGMIERLEGARRASSDIQSDIENAAGILEVFAECDTPIDDAARAWRQVEYAAKQIRRHAEALSAELEKVEYVAMALERARLASEPPPAEGGAA